MSIYDEAKVITHEEARKQIQSTNEYLETNIDPFGSFETYINQQEKKEERAKKVEELVGLYRRRPLYINSVQFDEIDKLIKLKEKELEAKE